MNTETYTKQAMGLLKTKDGQSTVDAKVRVSTEKLAKARASQKDALDNVAVRNKRHRFLNELSTSITGKYLERQHSLVDEFIDGDPPRDEFARAYDQLNCESRFVGAAISRLVEHHIPLAHRAVLAAQVAVSQAEYELADAQALAAMFTRVKLVQPLLTHESEISIQGGTTERLIEAAKNALLAYNRVREALTEYDAQRKIA